MRDIRILILLSSGALLALTSGARGETPAPRAATARVLNITDVARVTHTGEAYVRGLGNALVDEGSATGGLPGSVKVEFTLDIASGVSINAVFTIRGHDGEILGNGTGTLNKPKDPTSADPYRSFAGTMIVSHGTGIYADAHGAGGFYGVIDRKTFDAIIQTTGMLSY
jgi:hypothetical protein